MRISLQFFSAEPPQDYPDLNKCPDCETFFASLKCPLCGKECPEEMRAGNRKPIKKRKQNEYRRSSGRVQFVPWYFSNWFIIAFLIIQPVIGLILTWMGYWRRHWKIIATVLTVFIHLSGYLIYPLLSYFWREDIPVNTRMPQSEYIETCESIQAEPIFREPTQYEGRYVKLDMQIRGIVDDINAYDSAYATYYQCVVTENGQEWEFLVRDYRQEKNVNLTIGDTITVYGEVLGNVTVQGVYTEAIHAPAIGMLYVSLNGNVSASNQFPYFAYTEEYCSLVCINGINRCKI